MYVCMYVCMTDLLYIVWELYVCMYVCMYVCITDLLHITLDDHHEDVGGLLV
jgi:hypothetical protein